MDQENEIRAENDGGDVNAPVGNADAPVGNADAPVGNADAPVGSADAPVGSADAPVGNADAPVGNADAPVGSADAGNNRGGDMNEVLNEEVLFEILKRLPLDAMHFKRAVCPKWKMIIEQKVYRTIKSVAFCGDEKAFKSKYFLPRNKDRSYHVNISQAELMSKYFDYHQNVENLKFINYPWFSGMFQYVPVSRLQTLEFVNCDIIYGNDSNFDQGMARLSELKHLRFYDCPIKSNILDKIGAHLEELQTLVLGWEDKSQTIVHRDRPLASFFDVLAHAPDLHELTIKCKFATVMHITNMINAFVRKGVNTKYTRLDLKGVALDERNGAALWAISENLPSLRVLKLNFAVPPRKRQTRWTTTRFSAARSLEKLVLIDGASNENALFSYTVMSSIFGLTCGLPKLKSLSLTERDTLVMEFGEADEAAPREAPRGQLNEKTFSMCVGACPNLEVLKLDALGLLEVSLTRIGQCKKLQRLKLNNMNLTTDILMQIVADCPLLTLLEVDYFARPAIISQRNNIRTVFASRAIGVKFRLREPVRLPASAIDQMIQYFCANPNRPKMTFKLLDILLKREDRNEKKLSYRSPPNLVIKLHGVPVQHPRLSFATIKFGDNLMHELQLRVQRRQLRQASAPVPRVIEVLDDTAPPPTIQRNPVGLIRMHDLFNPHNPYRPDFGFDFELEALGHQNPLDNFRGNDDDNHDHDIFELPDFVNRHRPGFRRVNFREVRAQDVHNARDEDVHNARDEDVHNAGNEDGHNAGDEDGHNAGDEDGDNSDDEDGPNGGYADGRNFGYIRNHYDGDDTDDSDDSQQQQQPQEEEEEERNGCPDQGTSQGPTHLVQELVVDSVRLQNNERKPEYRADGYGGEYSNALFQSLIMQHSVRGRPRANPQNRSQGNFARSPRLPAQMDNDFPPILASEHYPAFRSEEGGVNHNIAVNMIPLGELEPPHPYGPN